MKSSIERRRASGARWPLLTWVLAVGCGVQDASASAAHTEGGPADESRARGRAVVDAAIARLDVPACFGRSAPEGCPMGSLRVAPTPRRDAHEEAVMVVDSFAGFSSLLYARSRLRLRALEKVTPDGLQPAAETLRAPEGLVGAIETLAAVPFLPAAELTQVAEKLLATMPYADPIPAGHGTVVMTMLTDLVTTTPLVLVDLGEDEAYSLGPHRELCDDPRNATHIAWRHAAAIKKAEGITRLMREHDVHYVNVSFGVSVPALEGTWRSLCGTPPPERSVLRAIVEADRPFYDALFATPGVMAFHAAYPNEGDDTPFDVASARWPNRIRVGFAQGYDLDVPSEGAADWRAVTMPDASSADLWIAWRCEFGRGCNGTPPLVIAPNGLRLLATPEIWPPATSWAAPVALARSVHVRATELEGLPFDDALVRRLREALVPARCGPTHSEPCRLQDPYRYEQFEYFRRGYGH